MQDPTMDALTLLRPDDWHLHLRDGAALVDTVREAARCFGRAIVMPNLRPPVRSTADALAYRERILACVPPRARFTPLMTLYLTNATPPSEVAAAVASGAVHAAKLYPAGATTNSAAGVTDLARIEATLAAMADQGLPLLVHGEVTDPAVDIFDRERAFIDRRLGPLLERHPRLRVVFEHVTTAAAVRFVTADQSGRLGATITAHHLLLNRNDLLAGGIRPHYYCLPVLKREADRAALLEAATGGDPRFFLGTDSAPHARETKEAPCGCAGIYTAPAALALYAEAFEAAGALPRLEGFASRHGAAFYGLPAPCESVRLVRRARRVPATVPLGGRQVV